jgi:hypothetical protein
LPSFPRPKDEKAMMLKLFPRTIFGLLIALACPVLPAAATTLEALPTTQAVHASGRVLSAVSDPASRTTLVVLGDDQGREVARFRTLGAVDGRVRWIAEGMPTFVVGEEVSVALEPGANGLELSLQSDAALQARTPAPAVTGIVPAVTDLLPSAGGAVPDDPELVTVRGTGFGTTQNDSHVSFLGVFQRVDAEVVSWSDQAIVCRIPAPGLRGTPQVLTGPVKVWTADGGWSDGDPFANGSSFAVLYQWAGDFWPTARLPIGVWVNPRNSPYGADLGTFAAQASSAWNVPGSYARFVYRGLTAVDGGNHGDPATPKDGRNTVQWRTTWNYQPEILALTWSSIDTLTLEREEVELEINGTRPWTTDPEAEPNKFDLISTMTHEFGHWLRLGHTQRVPSVMSAFASPGERRREISVGDAYGASWIHPSYGVAAVLQPLALDASLEVAVTALDRQGAPLAQLPASAIEVRAIRLAEDESPGELDPPLARAPEAAFNAAANTDGDGRTSVALDGLADGRYRIETLIGDRFVRPASIVRVGPVPAGPSYALALSGVTPSPLVPGAHGRVRFTLPSANEVTLVLYDARGRRVRVLASGAYAAGPHDVPFETTGEDGRTLGAGVYFLRLTAQAGFSPVTGRVVVLR